MTRERRRPRAAAGRASGAAWWEAAFAAVSAGIAVLDAATGEVLRVNEAFAAMVGRDAAGMVGTDLRQLLALDDVGAFTDTLEAARRGDTDRPEVVLCWPRAAGSVVSLRVSAAAVRLGDAAPRELLLHAHDATDQVGAERALVASRDLLAEAERLAHLGSFEWDIAADRVSWSDELCRIFGVPEGTPPSPLAAVLDRIHPDDVAALSELVTAALAGEAVAAEHRIVRPDGEVRWVSSRGRAVTDEAGAARRVVGTVQDVTSARAAKEQLVHGALHDSLTGLANRALFTERMTHAVGRARRQGSPLSLLFVDIDDLKGVNDALGHAAGDVLLQGVGTRLLASVRPGDTVARLGGDEFVVLLDDASEGAAVAVAERILGSLAPPFPVVGTELAVGASVGIAVADDPESTDRLLATADTALYAAKEAGKNRYMVFDRSMFSAVRDRSKARRDLASAVDEHQLLVHYQPIVEVPRGAVVAVEALVRWRHPERGVLRPTEFLPLADEAGLAVAVGSWVLRTACAQVGDWQRRYDGLRHLGVSVNLSAHQLHSAGLVPEVTGVLEATGLDPPSLTLEVSERLLDGPEPVLGVLGLLRDLGVRLSVDDFGAFSCSLRRLQRFTGGELKVDRSVVARLGDGERGAAMVGAAIDLGHALDLDAVAEGVETARQLQALAALGCDRGQGIYWMEPSPADDVEPWLVRAAPQRLRKQRRGAAPGGS